MRIPSFQWPERWTWWLVIAITYFLAQAVLYSQDRAQAAGAPASTPWEHLTLEGCLLVAVGVLYRENRAREANTTKLAVDAAASQAKAIELMENVTQALERLAEQVANLGRSGPR